MAGAYTPNRITWEGQPVHRIPAEPGPPKIVPHFKVTTEKFEKPWAKLTTRWKMRVENGRLVRWKALVWK